MKEQLLIQQFKPLIGYLKADHRMDRCHLKGSLGDCLHAVLCAAGYNLRWLLRMIAQKDTPFLRVFLLYCRGCSKGMQRRMAMVIHALGSLREVPTEIGRHGIAWAGN